MPDDKDPWKDPPREPEFDLWLKNLRNRWGRRRAGGRDPWRGLRRNHRITLFLPLIVLTGFWLSSGFVRIPGGRVGYAFLAGRPTGPLAAGLHWLAPWPFVTVLTAPAPVSGPRVLKMHASTADGRRLVVTLRYRVATPRPRAAALDVQGFDALVRARLRRLLLLLTLRFTRQALRQPSARARLRAALVRLWADGDPARTPPLRKALAAAASPAATPVPSFWGRLRVLGVAFSPPRATRKARDALRRLARRQAAKVAAVREKGRVRRGLARLEARALLARALRARAALDARIRNRINVFRIFLPVYRRNPALARRLLALSLLRRALDRRRHALLIGRRVHVVLGLPAARTALRPARVRKPRKGSRPLPSSSSGTPDRT